MAKVTFAEHHDMVEALAAERSPRAAWRGV
jgi:hypothetical protein